MSSSEEKWQRAEMEKRRLQRELDAANAREAEHVQGKYWSWSYVVFFAIIAAGLALADRQGREMPTSFGPPPFPAPEVDKEHGVVWYTTEQTPDFTTDMCHIKCAAVLDQLPVPARGFRGNGPRQTPYGNSALESGLKKHNAGHFDGMTEAEQKAVVDYAVGITGLKKEVARRLGLTSEFLRGRLERGEMKSEQSGRPPLKPKVPENPFRDAPVFRFYDD